MRKDNNVTKRQNGISGSFSVISQLAPSESLLRLWELKISFQYRDSWPLV